MADARQLRRLTGDLGVALDDLGSVLDNIDMLFFFVPNPAGKHTVAAAASGQLTSAREEAEGHLEELRARLEERFGPVQVEPVMAQALSDSAEPTLIQQIVAGVSEEAPHIAFSGEFGGVLKMPAIAEHLLDVAERLRADPPPVWDTERNIQAAWAIGRAGRLTLEHAARVRRAAVKRYPLLKDVPTFDEEIDRLDAAVKQRLEGLRERGLYVFPEPPLFQAEAHDRPRPGTVTDLKAVMRDRAGGPAKRGGTGAPARGKPRGGGPRAGS